MRRVLRVRRVLWLLGVLRVLGHIVLNLRVIRPLGLPYRLPEQRPKIKRERGTYEGRCLHSDVARSSTATTRGSGAPTS